MTPFYRLLMLSLAFLAVSQGLEAQDAPWCRQHSITPVSRPAAQTYSGTFRLVQKPQILLFPNPATDRLYIQLPMLQREPLTEVLIRIFTLSGDKIVDGQLPHQNGLITLSLSGWPANYYLVEIRNPQGMLLKKEKVYVSGG